MKFNQKQGRHYYFQDMEYWAQGGMIHIYDHRDDTMESVSPPRFLARAIAMGGEIPYEIYSDERKDKERLCNEMQKCVAEAVVQGDPTDPEVSEYKLRHKSKCGKWISVPTLPKDMGTKRLVIGK